jgi:hypothetical protein
VYLILEKARRQPDERDHPCCIPQLTPEHIGASLEYAARLAADEIVLTNQ